MAVARDETWWFLVPLIVPRQGGHFSGKPENTLNFKMTLENLEKLENEAKILEKIGNLILIRKKIFCEKSVQNEHIGY